MSKLASGLLILPAHSLILFSLSESFKSCWTVRKISLGLSTLTAAPFSMRYKVLFVSWPGIGFTIIMGIFLAKTSAVVTPPGFVIIISDMSISSWILWIKPKTITFFLYFFTLLFRVL